MRMATMAVVLGLSSTVSAGAQVPDQLDRDLTRLVNDYTGLYTKDTFEQWRTLFLPSFAVASTTAEGGVSMRTLEQFLAAQQRGFAERTRMGERLENVAIDRRGRIATVRADFVFWHDDETSRGKLALLAIADRTGWHFQSLVFSYHD